MQNADIWLTPLIILPGVGLLILSTAARAGQLHGLLRQLRNDKQKPPPQVIEHLFIRATRFRNALTCFYVSAGLFGLTTFLHGLLEHLHVPHSLWSVLMFSFLGLLTLIWGTFELFRESLLSLEIIDEYRKHFEVE